MKEWIKKQFEPVNKGAVAVGRYRREYKGRRWKYTVKVPTKGIVGAKKEEKEEPYVNIDDPWDPKNED